MLKPSLQWRYVATGLLACDILLGTIAFSLVYLARYRLEILPHRPQPTAVVIVVGVATWIAALWLERLYSSRQVGSGFTEYSRVVAAGTWSLAAGLLMVFIFSFTISRAFLLMAWALSTAFVLVGRFVARRVVRRLARLGYRMRRVIVVGASPQGLAIANELANNPAASADVIGFLDDYKSAGTRVGSITVLGDAGSLGSISARLGATHAIVVTAALSWESWQTILGHTCAGGPELLLAPGTFEPHANALEVAPLGGAVLLHPHPSRIIGAEAALKRIFDIAMASVALLAALPFALFVVLARRSSRPWLSWQSVHAPGAKVLRIPLFRDGLLSSWHLTRVPAAYQILLGRMSVVGPSPVLIGDELHSRSSEALLLSMKPGLIGPWWLIRQAGRDVDAEIAADLAYARSYTVWLDLVIVLRAVFTLLAGVVDGRRRPAFSEPTTSVAESQVGRAG